MTNDRFIKNWWRKNKSWLSLFFTLASIWIALIILLTGIKYWCFGIQKWNFDLARISLNNILTLGAVISATSFAWRQIEINQHAAKTELAIRYKDHYVKLVKALRNFINSHAELGAETPLKIQESILIELIDVTLEGQLIFDIETQKVNGEIRLHANDVMQSKRMMKFEGLSFLDRQKAEEQYWTAYSLLIGEYGKKSIFDQATELYKKNTAILTNIPIN